MEVYTEHYAAEETLYKRVDEILAQGGLYNITQHPAGFTVNFWFFEGCDIAYKVVKGRAGDNGLFTFHIGPEYFGQDMVLEKGDVLIFESEGAQKNIVWFYCPKVLIGMQTAETWQAHGFTRYGSVLDMCEEGLIEKTSLVSVRSL